MQLPRGATPIDFAYAVHTEVGNRCSGAKVNGRIAPLARALKNGDTVEILTSDSQRPNRDWLSFVRTSRARHRIRNWIRDEEQVSATQLGKDILAREWRRRKAKPDDADLERAAKKLSLHGGVDALHATVGRGDIGIAKVVHAVLPDDTEPVARTVTPLSKLVKRVWTTPKGVKIQGMDNLMVRYSQCCQPVPGDDVMGYITVGRGISIHRRDCPNVLNLPNVPERRVVIDWGTDGAQRFLVRIVMEGTDRHGLFADIARAVSDTGTNIQSASITAVEGGMQGQFVVEVENLAHLKKVLRKIRRVKGVLSVERKESLGDSDLMLAGGEPIPEQSGIEED
jgi:GTP pyrophosphokinase